MPWQVGIDEAGYGPNLGPFVMTLVACKVPTDLHEANLWDVLRSAVRRAEEPADHRLVVADSKLVYSPVGGWNALERTVLAGGWCDRPDTLHLALERLAEAHLPLLREEAWYVGDTPLPTEGTADDHAGHAELWQQACRSTEVAWVVCRSVVVPTPRFNDIVDQWDSKGAVLSVALAQLMRECLAATTPEPMRFTIDKHGGRNVYSAMLQHAFDGGFVLAEEEGRHRSVYRVEGLDRPVRITFMPKADVEHFTVALASMVSKYLRELLMREFNRYWQTHVPGLKPTAGYPQDAPRFLEAIRPVLTRLGIAERLVWRSR